MHIAVGEKDGRIVRCFEEIETFRVYETDSRLPADFLMAVENDDDFAGNLKKAGTDILICGSLDHTAEFELAKAGIALIRDVEGYASDAVLAWKMGYIRPEERPVCVNAHFGK